MDNTSNPVDQSNPVQRNQSNSHSVSRSKVQSVKNTVKNVKNSVKYGRWSLSRYNNFTVRTILSLFLCVGFLFLLSFGHFYITLLVVISVVKMYYEIVSLHDKAMSFAVTSDDEFSGITPSRRSHRSKSVYFFSRAPDLLSWISLETYFLSCALVLVSVPWLVPRLQHYNNWLSRALLRAAGYHYLISFVLTLAGVVKFVVSLEKGRYKQHFLKLAMIVVSLLYVVCQGLMVVTNIYYGMVWFLCPHVMVAVNDVLAYLFGRYVGKRPLIVISPKKTVEGFLYSALVTTLLTLCLTPFMLKFKALLCPTNHFNLRPLIWLKNTQCKLPSVYTIHTLTILNPLYTIYTQLTDSPLSTHLTWLTKLIGFVCEVMGKEWKLRYTEFALHMLVLSLFASLLAPFGGFLASGFKRALKVKDFSNVIPGHGGITDRFDCHILMGGFTYFYLKTFVRKQQLVEVVYKMFLKLPKNEQLDLLVKFKQLH